MKLYYVHTGSSKRCQIHFDILKKACEERSHELVSLDVEKISFFDLPKIEDGDALYRHGLGNASRDVEKLLIHEKVSTLHSNWKAVLGVRASSYYFMEKEKLPVIKTVPVVPLDEAGLLKTAEYLGGFPLILKVHGNSKGEGILKVDSLEALKSLVGFLHKSRHNFFAREFIQHDHYGRLVVLGDVVIGSHKTYVAENEFRTNAPGNLDGNKMPAKFSEEIEDIAIRAVKSLGLEFGGVDLLFMENGEVRISEVNFPCGFESTQRIGEVDIAGPMVDHLYQKGLSILSK